MSFATRARGQGPAGSTSCPGPLRPVPECLRCRPTLPSNLSSGPRAHGRPAVPGILGPCPMSHCVYQVSRAIQVQVGGTTVLTSCPGSLGPGSEGPCVRQALPGKSRSGPMSHGVDQLSGATWARVPGPAGSTSCHGRLRPGSEGLQGRPAILRDSGLCLRAHGVDQMSQALGPGSEGPWGPPGVPGNSPSLLI